MDGVGKIAKGRGRKSPLTEGTVAEIVWVTCQDKPGDGGTHWTTRSLAKRFGLGKDTIASHLLQLGALPRRQRKSRSSHNRHDPMMPRLYRRRT